MRKGAQAAFGAALALALLWVLFRGTDWGALARIVAGVDLRWLLVSHLLMWASYFTRVERWAYVVRASHPASFRHLLSASQIGVLVNFTIPGRLGELARALVLGRLARLPLPRALAFVALDRVTDVVGLLSVLLVAALAVAGEARLSLPPGTFGNSDPIAFSDRWVRPAALGIAGLVAIATLGLFLLYLRQESVVALARRVVGRVSSAWADRVGALLVGFAEGLRVFGSRRDLFRALAWSIVTWMLEVASVATALDAFAIDYPWHAPFLMLALIAVAIAIPATPGVVGQFHLPAVAGLLLAAPHVDPARAKAVAVVDHVSTLIPVALLGAFCLYRERLGFVSVVRGSARAEEEA